MPKVAPAAMVSASLEVGEDEQLLASSNQPEKESRENGLSAYGADRNSPAGDSTWSRAATRAHRVSLQMCDPSW